MSRMMQTWTPANAPFCKERAAKLFADVGKNGDSSLLSYEEALAGGLIEVETADFEHGVPYSRVINHSAWKILLFSGREIIGQAADRLLGIEIVLHHNASAVIPAFFLSSTFFFDQGMTSIQHYLRCFPANDRQSSVVFTIDGKNCGERHGDFPLRVHVRYSQFAVHKQEMRSTH